MAIGQPHNARNSTIATPTTEPLLRVRDFAANLGMSEAWARKYIALGKVRIRRIGRSVRVPASEVAKFSR